MREHEAFCANEELVHRNLACHAVLFGGGKAERDEVGMR